MIFYLTCQAQVSICDSIIPTVQRGYCDQFHLFVCLFFVCALKGKRRDRELSTPKSVDMTGFMTLRSRGQGEVTVRVRVRLGTLE